MRELFDSTVQRLFADIASPEATLALTAGGWPAAQWQAVEDSGFSLASAAEDNGGAGASWDDLYVVVRAAGYFALPLPLPEALLGNWLLDRAGLAAVGGPLTIGAQSTLAIAGGKVSGELREVPWGRHPGGVVAVAGDTVVLLDSASASASSLQLNLAGEPRDSLVFDGATPLASAPLPAALGTDVLLLGGAMLRAAQIAGALQAVLDMSVAYAGERSQFGRPIAGFQAIQHALAVLAEHTACAMVAAEAAFAESGEQLARLPLMAAKVCASDAAGVATATAHAVHGAIGITKEHSLHLLTQRLWSWRSEFGSSTHWSQQIGRLACQGGAAAYWPTVTGAAA